VFVVLVLCGVAAKASAAEEIVLKQDAATLGADAGLNFFSGGFGTGFGFNVYPGYRLANGVTLEVQIGLHFASNGPASLTAIPLYVGGRYDLSSAINMGNIKPFAGAHVGLLHSSVSVDLGSGFGTASGSGNDLVINLGAGADVPLDKQFSLGGVIWYELVPNNTNNGWFTLGVNARYNFG
jgi:hypothetical protein